MSAEDTPQMSAGQARAMLQAIEKQRADQCQKELNELLARHKFQLAAQLGITSDGRIAANIILVPVAEQ